MYPFVRALDYVQLAGAKSRTCDRSTTLLLLPVDQAVIDGAGLIQTALPYVEAGLKSQLVTVLDDFAPPSVDGFFLFYPSRRQIRPPLKAFIDHLRQQRSTSGNDARAE